MNNRRNFQRGFWWKYKERTEWIRVKFPMEFSKALQKKFQKNAVVIFKEIAEHFFRNCERIPWRNGQNCFLNNFQLKYKEITKEILMKMPKKFLNVLQKELPKKFP